MRQHHLYILYFKMKKEEKIKAQLVIVVGLLALSYLFKIELLVPISLGLGLIFLIIPALGDLIVKGWFKLAEGLGWINSKILLSIIYFFILFPTALLQKLFSKKDTLLLKNKNLKSTFTTRNHTYKKKDMKYGW